MQSGSKNPVDVARLKADIAADRIRLRYSPQDIVHSGERSDLKKAFASAGALCRFFSQLEAQFHQGEER